MTFMSKVIGEECEKCTKLYEHVCQAAEQLELKADIKKVEDLIEMVQLGGMSTPSVMVDGQLIISGRCQVSYRDDASEKDVNQEKLRKSRYKIRGYKMGNIKSEYTCSLILINDLIGGKWKQRILWHIINGDNRFSLLQKKAYLISHIKC